MLFTGVRSLLHTSVVHLCCSSQMVHNISLHTVVHTHRTHPSYIFVLHLCCTLFNLSYTFMVHLCTPHLSYTFVIHFCHVTFLVHISAQLYTNVYDLCVWLRCTTNVYNTCVKQRCCMTKAYQKSVQQMWVCGTNNSDWSPSVLGRFPFKNGGCCQSWILLEFQSLN